MKKNKTNTIIKYIYKTRQRKIKNNVEWDKPKPNILCYGQIQREQIHRTDSKQTNYTKNRDTDIYQKIDNHIHRKTNKVAFYERLY